MMTSKTEYKPRNVKIFDLDEFEKLLKDVKVPACMITEAPVVVDEQSVIKRVSALTLGGFTGGEQCSCCGAGPFESRAQQTAHYKHHWHAHNLKRRLFGKSPLTLSQFNSRQDDNSSVSGSDSESEDVTASSPGSDLFAAATRHCKAFFTNAAGQVFCIYRCVLHHRKEDLSTDGEGKVWIERCRRIALPGAQRWAVLMVSGGHFAGAVFSGSVPVLHKTQHSYVVRRGQGQAQGARDQQGNAPKSAGASLRRYNMAQFVQHVHDILNSWTEDLNGCSLVLYRAVGPGNQMALFGKGSPLSREDARVRALPFPTRKPTYREVRRAHDTVANIEVYDSMELFQKAVVASGKPAPDSSGDRSRKKPSPNKPVLNRAKSREPIARELPTLVTSSEDEGPCFIDSETPVDWIKTLSEQTSNGLITASRKDLINNDLSIASPESSETESEIVPEQKALATKKKKKKKQDKAEVAKKEKGSAPKVAPVKIPASVKKMWKVISGNELHSLETIFEGWEPTAVSVADACNTADPVDGNTALHKAAIADKPDMVKQILQAGGDPCARNLALQTPYAAAQQQTRLAFRLFQAEHPDRYNYAKAHIPGPLTPELLEQEIEKKAAQKRAKRQKDKEKQAEKIRASKFLAMKDSEKMQSQELRCFLCGVSLPKTPFQYDVYRFCSIKCLQNHRNLRPLNMPP
ncbi:hypothetical protein JYU34_005654 [Plutella xylostella]|uniref:VLRF1 domain-containing protein n=1 Tax=Plutella xylostella TaxID=51655 RepID=A0ABQ7QTT8_PLUXY|nr:hypothetical protein JYU34_005654 [Plutella xylostella]